MNCPYPKEYVFGRGPVPCGRCIICLENKRNEWAFRLEQEHKYSSGSLFVTLTYHDGSLPERGVTKRHVQLWLKRLRKKLSERMRYYLVGEYGSKFGRAHYHALLFNVPMEAESLVRASWTYRSKPIGFVHCGKVTQGRIRYITKYVIQRDGAPAGKLHPPFALMSRGYGIGAMYLSDAVVEWHRRNRANYAHYFETRVRLPRFYKEKIWYRLVHRNRYEVSVHPDRKVVRMEAKARMEDSRNENNKILKDAGYDPDVIQAEMRNAAAARIKGKIAYSQKL